MMYTGFFEVWPWWRLRHFERTHLLHLNTEMVMKRGFSVFRRWLCRKVLLYLQDNFPYPPPAQSFSYPSLMCQCFGVDSICDSTPHAISNLFFVGSHEMGQILSERYSLSGGGSNAEPFDWEADRHSTTELLPPLYLTTPFSPAGMPCTRTCYSSVASPSAWTTTWSTRFFNSGSSSATASGSTRSVRGSTCPATTRCSACGSRSTTSCGTTSKPVSTRTN